MNLIKKRRLKKRIQAGQNLYNLRKRLDNPNEYPVLTKEHMAELIDRLVYLEEVVKEELK
jgi:hypothetical protein